VFEHPDYPSAHDADRSRADMPSQDLIPFGLCHCGCGESAPIAQRTRHARGDVKGRPLRYIYGHRKFTHEESALGIASIRRKAERLLPSRFWSSVDRRSESECWPFVGAKTKFGHGRTTLRGHSTTAQRVAWVLAEKYRPERMSATSATTRPVVILPTYF
jgi:hypothetical protein